MQLSTFTTLLLLISSISAAPPALSPDDTLTSHSLEKRRGGGGRGGSGGGSSGGRGSSGYSFSSSSNSGGRTRDGSGTPATYGGRYVGGVSVPYTAGGRSPTRGVTPFLLPIGALAFFPGIWLFSVYAYPFGYGYHYLGADGRNRTSNVTCLCQEYSVCGCDPSDNATFVAQMLTNASVDQVPKDGAAPVNTSLVRTVDYGNGTVESYINGTLDNGTTATGGTDPSNDSQISAAVKLVAQWSGYWLMIATVVVGVVM